MYKNLIILSFVILFIRIDAQAWPNNLLFTLEAKSNVTLQEPLPSDYEIIQAGGEIYIGKFKLPEEAENAQNHLKDLGIQTELKAFFRARPIDLKDAITLSKNMNSHEEAVMLDKTKSVPEVSKKATEQQKSPKAKPKNESPVPEKPSTDKNRAYFTIQLGVFSKSVKHKYNFEVKEKVINGKYYCFYGSFLSLDDAKNHLKEIKEKGYEDAFITGFNGDKKVKVEIVKQVLDHS